jgi:hypothetical protein
MFVRKIDKGVTIITFMLEIHGQIEEIIFVPESHIYLFSYQFRSVLVRDVSDHQCGPPVRKNLKINKNQ